MVSATQGRGNVRWVDYARRSMQRLGFVKWLLSLASTSHPQTLESLTRTFFLNVTKVVPVDPDRRDSFEKYIKQQQLHRRYREGSESAQIQDLYLSDPTLQSHTGAVTGDLERKGFRHAVYVEIPTWATRLRLIRQQNYTLTDRGRVLLLVDTHAARSSSVRDDKNPFCLNVYERYVSLFSLLDADGDFLRAMYQKLLEVQTFTRADAGDAAVQALENLRSTRLKTVSAGPLQQVRAKIDRTIAAVQKQSHGSQGGLGPKESIATPRTEPLVDCGILSKPNPDKYEYSFTEWGRNFLTALAGDISVSDFVESRLSLAMSSSTGHHLSVEPPTLQVVARPYTELRSGLGYVSLRELAVAAIGLAFESPDAQLFEITAIEQALKRAAGQNDRRVRLALGRTGGIAQVRIDQRALKEDGFRD
jgi:hypothetical protein